jgi:hypothetical protein
MARAFSISRMRVSGFFALSIVRTYSPLAAVGQAVVGGAGDRIGVQGAGEVRGLGHNTGLGIDFHLDLDLVAGHDTGGLPVGVAEAEQVAATHDGYPALP